jgi:hypothetical protein
MTETLHLTALAGVTVPPCSGFWSLLAICLRGMLRSRPGA